MKNWIFSIALGWCSLVTAQVPLVQQTANQVSLDSMVTTVKQLTGLLPIEGTTILNSRFKGTVGNTLTSNFIQRKLASYGVAFDTVNFGGTGTNIIAKIPGRRTDRVILIGGHFDAVGGSNLEFFYPGADDNASGTAAVLEAARVCANQQFPISLHFAFWDEEEQGLVGSQASVYDYLQGNTLVAYINLDMIAWSMNNDSVVEIHTRPSGNSVELANRIVEIISRYQIPLNPVVMNPGDPNTDHGTFWANNLTAVGINEIYNGPKMNPNWHRLTDSLSTFNLPYFHQMAKLATTAFLDLAMDSFGLVGVSEESRLAQAVLAYPNPANTELSLQLSPNLHLIDVNMYNQLGDEVNLMREDDQLQLPVSLANGLYWLSISVKQNGSNEVFTVRKKIAIQH